MRVPIVGTSPQEYYDLELRSSGGGWDRDEWDVTVSEGATYRVFRERDTDAWFVDGVVD